MKKTTIVVSLGIVLGLGMKVGLGLAKEPKRGTETSILSLIQDLDSEDDLVKADAIRELGNLKAKESVPKIINALQDGNRIIRADAADALGKIGDKRAVSHLIERLKDEDWCVKAQAADALGKIGDKRAVSYLIERLKDKKENWSIQRRAAQALANIGDPKAFQPLIDALIYECKVERENLYPPPRKSVGTDDESVEIEIMGTIVNFIKKTEDAKIKERYIRKLTEYMHNEKKLTKLKYYFATILGNLGDKNVAPILIDYLENGENGLFRERSAWLLGDLGDKRAIEPLKKALKDDYICVATGDVKKVYGYTVRQAAAQSLKKLGVKVERKGNEYKAIER
jgi:HEAT repeat protein